MEEERASNKDMEFAKQVDAWLEKKGLSVDAPDIDGKPACFAAAYQGIIKLVDDFGEVKDATSAPVPTKRVKGLRGGKYGGVFAARFPGNPIGTAITVAELEASKEALGVFLNGSNMGDAAKIWDTTFLNCTCLDEMPIESKDYTKDAKPFLVPRIIQWKFSAGPMAKRELVHCIAPIPHAEGPERYTFVYLAVKGTPISKGYVRARMLYPSFDSISRSEGDKWNFHHSMTCHLRGWIPNWFHTSVIDKKVVAQLDSEIVHIQKLFENPSFKVLVSGSSE